MSMTNMMTNSKLSPIPVDYVVGHAMALNTAAKRKPYTDLILQWAEHEGMEAEGRSIVGELTGVAEISADNMPREITEYYRESSKAALLINMVRAINDEIDGGALWTWAHVMRVMVDEHIVSAQIKVNRFDSIICSMIPGKGKDTVRKKGDFSIMLDRSLSYRTWSITSLNPIEADNRRICDEIVKKLKPILLRNDPSQQEA